MGGLAFFPIFIGFLFIILSQILIVVLVVISFMFLRMVLFGGGYELKVVLLVKRAARVVGISLILASLFSLFIKGNTLSSYVFLVTYVLVLLMSGEYPMELVKVTEGGLSKHEEGFEKAVLLVMVMLCAAGLAYLQSNMVNILRIKI